ncbi:MAG TPA: response regulator [Bryobacteraceae bacterium]|nr:response regulator [Bryobacteraceae bacterium]
MQGKVILLVEDNRTDEELTTRALKNSGVPVSVKVARNGEDALALLLSAEAHTLPDLVLLDLKLMKGSGLHVLETLRAAPRTRTLPVVVLTSSTKHDDVTAAYRAGCNGYISKGVDYRQFVEAAKTAVQYWLVHNVAPGEPEDVG